MESIARWQFGLHEEGDGGVTITRADPKYGWHHSSRYDAHLELDGKIARSLIDDALAKPSDHPEACLQNDVLWSDMTEKGNGVTRDQATDTLCVTISVFVNGRMECHYALRHDNPAWLNSGIWRTVGSWLQAELTKQPSSPSAS